jgi:hypothetical protein
MSTAISARLPSLLGHPFDLLQYSAYCLHIGTASHLHKITEALSSEDVATLQFARSTFSNAIISTAKQGDRVGILGIGGLRDLAIQFSVKLEIEIAVFFLRLRGRLRPGFGCYGVLSPDRD